MKIWIVNDDAYDRQACSAQALQAFPDANITTFESLFDAHERFDNPDIVIIDLSAVAPIGLGFSNHHYGPICTFMDRHFGATVIITSAVSKNFAEDVKEEVLEQNPDAQIHLVEWPWHTKLIDTLRTLA